MSLTPYPTLRLKLTQPQALQMRFLPAVPGSLALAGKVNRSGDTMTGSLILAADPTVALEAATKNYVDTHGGGAPTDADYLVRTANAGLSAERVVTDTATVTWDWATSGQAKANVPNGSITNAMLADVTSPMLKGRTTAGTGSVENLTPTQATALLNTMVGANGAGGTKGLVPAPAAGDAAAGRFLKADGTWAAPPGTGAGGVPIGGSIPWNQSDPPTNFLVEDGSTLNSSTYAALFAVLVKSATITMTIASPCVVTWTGNTLANNVPIKFTTSGALPTGLTVGTVYYVKGLSGNTFNVSATPGGAAINTSGSQSGTHTGINAPWGCANNLTTFNLPDSRAEFIRGWDIARGVDSNRGFGVAQSDAFQGHRHNVTWSPTYGISGGGGAADGGGSNQDVAISISILDPITDGSNGTPRTAAETRSRNVTKLWCIKYQ